ncbi:MAG: hypothetical protein IJW67_08275 [Blautia sp.]|nr:hypothetical protein [Blautia sp.]
MKLNLPEIEKEADTFYIYPTANSLDDENCRPLCAIDDENMRASSQDCLEWRMPVWTPGVERL